jgi:small subunit ribosomal protein S18
MPKKQRAKTNTKRRKQKGNCYFEESKTTPNYKDVLILRRFISDRGKLTPREYTNVTSKNQRLLAREVKKARFMALLPYTDKHAI